MWLRARRSPITSFDETTLFFVMACA